MGKVKGLEGKELYNDGRIQICQAGVPDEHEALINGMYLSIPRGVLREWASADSDRIRQGYVAMTQDYHCQRFLEMGISIEEFVLAISRARIRELEEERDFFIARSRRV